MATHDRHTCHPIVIEGTRPSKGRRAMRVWNGGTGNPANPGGGRKTPRRSSAPSAFRISTRRRQMGRGGKDRPCSPPRHQGRQGKENPLRSSASFAFRISTRRTQRDADGHIAKKGGTDPHCYERFRSPHRHQGRERAKTSWFLCVLVVGYRESPVPPGPRRGTAFLIQGPVFDVFLSPPEPMKIATAVDLRQSTDPDFRETWAPRAPRARRVMP